jgi:hypothetical protein
MQESKETRQAREMADFCKQRVKERGSRRKRSAIAQAVYSVVVAAFLFLERMNEIHFIDDWS